MEALSPSSLLGREELPGATKKTGHVWIFLNRSHVGKTIINHPPVITISISDTNQSQSWVVHGIVLPTLTQFDAARLVRPGTSSK